MKTLSLSALIAAGMLAGGITTAQAADLGVGGNCCADLEERIAELEATTARKGNRKVSLTISGWVAQQVLFWDDGITKNAYVADLGNALASHIKLTGSAKISTDWSAGYVLHIEAISNEPLALAQDHDNFRSGVGVYQSYWFLKSNQLGQISVGLNSPAADNAALLPDPSGTIAAANYVLYDNNLFALVRNIGGVKQRTNQTWGSLATCATIAGSAVGAGGSGSFIRNLGAANDCNTAPTNNIRYDSPTLAGFSASASWGEDDVWDVTGRYAADYNGVKVSAAIAYVDSMDDNGSPDLKAIGGLKAQALQVGASVLHVPTGLFIFGAYGHDYNENVSAFKGKKDGDNFYFKGGIRQKWNSLGHTVLFAEYGEDHDKQSIDAWNKGITGSNITQWGLGVQQEIDSAAMAIWAVYRNYSADQTCSDTAGDGSCASARFGGLGKQTFEDINIFKIGGLISF